MINTEIDKSPVESEDILTVLTRQGRITPIYKESVDFERAIERMEKAQRIRIEKAMKEGRFKPYKQKKGLSFVIASMLASLFFSKKDLNELQFPNKKKENP